MTKLKRQHQTLYCFVVCCILLLLMFGASYSLLFIWLNDRMHLFHGSTYPHMGWPQDPGFWRKLLTELKDTFSKTIYHPTPSFEGHGVLVLPWVKLMYCVSFLHPLVRTLVWRRGESWSFPNFQCCASALYTRAWNSWRFIWFDPPLDTASLSWFLRHVCVCIYICIYFKVIPF